MEIAPSNGGEDQPQALWLYRHPYVIEAARYDHQLANRLDAISQLEGFLKENPDDVDKQPMYALMREAVEQDCRDRFPDLLKKPSPES